MSSFFQRKQAWIFYQVFLCIILIAVPPAAAQTTSSISVSGVLKEQPPVAAFIGAPASGTDPLLVTFTDQSTHFPGSWKWEYRNATAGWMKFSTLQNPMNTFPAGTYDIRLTVTNSAGSDSVTKKEYISVTQVTEKVKRPVALFDTDPKVGSAPLKVTFTDKSQHDPTTYSWSFGDGTTSTLKNPSAHTYTQPGLYRVELTVSNSAGSDTGVRFVFTVPRWLWFD